MEYEVTIGIPMYNVEDYINRTMASALSQTYANIQFLIVDDGSTDNSVNIVEEIRKFHPRKKDIHLIVLPNNQGPSNARNLIIEKAQGKFLFFMDSDDIIREDTISLMMKYVIQEKADIVFGSLEIIGLSGERTLIQYPEMHFYKGDDFAMFSYRKYAGIQASSCNILARLSIIRENGLRFFPSNFWEDFVFVLDLVTYYSRAVLLSDITYTYLCRLNSLSNFQERNAVDKSEVLRNVEVAGFLKANSCRLKTKPYYPQRCYVAAMTDFYIACHILKQQQIIIPPMTYKEIKSLFTHPASFFEICSFRQCRLNNLFLYLLGKMPYYFSVPIVWILGKKKKLI